MRDIAVILIVFIPLVLLAYLVMAGNGHQVNNVFSNISFGLSE